MKAIGLIGGMSWESTALYYRLLNEGARVRAGGLSSARLILWNFDFAEIEPLQKARAWGEAGARLAEAARRLEAAGAEIVILATNTMHICAGKIEAALNRPFLHIADVAAQAIKARGFSSPGVLGTRFTMEGGFYLDRLADRHRLTPLAPDEADRQIIDRVIYEELVRGLINPASKRAYLGVIERLRARGADCVILGCTEIVLLIEEGDAALPLFDTTSLHVEAALARAFDEEQAL